MGRASSTKRVQRAARAGGRRKASQRRSSWIWPGLVSLVVVLGIGLIVISRSERQSLAEGPRPRLVATHPEDHWHQAYGIFVCDKYLPKLPEPPNIFGIHTHGDGLIHVEAIDASETGKNATLGKFVSEYPGLGLTDKELTVPGDKTYKNGDKCGPAPGKPGKVQVKVWSSPTDKKPAILSKDPAKLGLEDNQVIAIAFAPVGTNIPQPDSVPALKNPNEAERRPPGLPASPTPTAAPSVPPASGSPGPSSGSSTPSSSKQ